MNWIHLAQDRNKWRAVVNAVMSFRISYHLGNVSARQRDMTSQEGFGSMDLLIS
jgi:hypothetical protein